MSKRTLAISVVNIAASISLLVVAQRFDLWVAYNFGLVVCYFQLKKWE